MIKKICLSGLFSMMLMACSQIPKEAYFNRGDPEALLDATSEVVDLKIDSASSVQDITNWINKDQPTRAEINCTEEDAVCEQVRDVLHQFGVPAKFVSSADNNVTLVYERVQARDCENRYIDNIVNPYNLNHPTFGCSLSVNAVQMVSDKRQFTSPPLMDYADSYKANQAIQSYAKAPDVTGNRVDTNFQPIATQATIATDSGSGGGAGGSSAGGGGAGTTSVSR